MRYLGIDFGTKKIGLALSDEAGTMGFPHTVIPNDKEAFPSVSSLIEKENVGAVVIGESKSLSGDDNPVAEGARAFGARLELEGVTVFFEPEMFTTQEARRTPEGERATWGNVDASAAALILTSYLSRSHGNH